MYVYTLHIPRDIHIQGGSKFLRNIGTTMYWNKSTTENEKTIVKPNPHSMIESPQQNTVQPHLRISSQIAVSIDHAREEMDGTPPMRPQHIYTTTHHPLDRPSYLKLFTNELFLSRIILLFITIFLFLLSLSYSFGQILSVELRDFWCDRFTLSEVRAHSKKIGSNTGVPFSCWTTNLNSVNCI